MPSLRSICLGLLLTPLVQFSAAIPVAPAADCVTARATPTIPASGTTPDLPTTSLALKYVLIGRGTQNYTCSAPSATPAQVGAVATLFDATALAYRSTKILHSIPPLAVNVPVSKASLNLAAQSLKPIGQHFFDAAGTPVFDLSAVKNILYAAKVTNVPAPAGASKGPGNVGVGAVDWLLLSAKENYTASVGVSTVYRVVTAGGKAVCDVAGAQQVAYAAEYWFYG